MATAAQSVISSLLGKGWNKSQLARYVGRDASLISQAAKGGKPIENLLPALKHLDSLKGSPSSLALTLGRANVPARQQRVRQPAQRLGAATTPEAQRPLFIETTGNADARRALEQMAKEGKRIQVTADSTNVKRKQYARRKGRPPTGKGAQEKRSEVTLYQKGGYDAQRALDRINNPQPGDSWKPGDVTGFFKAQERAIPGIQHAGTLKNLKIYGYNPTGGQE